MRSDNHDINNTSGGETVGRTYRILEVGDEIVPILVLLETSERHLGTGDVLCAGICMKPRAALMTWRDVHTFLGFSR